MKRCLAALLVLATLDAAAQSYDTIVGESRTLPAPDAHWFSVRGSYGTDTAYLIDGDTGTVEGTLTLSMFTPALAPHIDAGRIYSYGSYYTRTYYGERTDLVLIYDLESAFAEKEIEIPPKSAGMGHSGMLGLINERFLGVWNITPAMSVSIVDTQTESFLGEISTPGCAGVYPVAEGFFMACGDGRVQYLRLDEGGAEVERLRSEAFFSTEDDPVFDYAVPTADGWLFVSLEGRVFEVTLGDYGVAVSEPWSINPPDVAGARDLNGVAIAADDDWRIGGSQPFAYNAEHQLLVTLMHRGGGQETYEDPGTEIWAFHTGLGRRAYRLALDEHTMGKAVQLTADDQPLLLVAAEEGGVLQIHDALTGRLLRKVPEIYGKLIQRLD